MAEPRPFSRSGNLLKAPPPLPKRKEIFGVSAGPNQFQEAARSLESSGFKVRNGQLTPTQDYGSMVGLASEQRNSLSRGSRPGSISTLGNPMGSMYAANPGFFNRGPSGGAAISPEEARAQNIARAKEAGTFDIIRDQYNAKGGAQMNEFGTIGAPAAPAPAASPTAESVAAQRASIQGAAAPAAVSGGPITDQLINGASQRSPVNSPMRPPAASGGPMTDKLINEASQRPVPVPAAPVPAAPVPAPAAPSQVDLNRQALEQRAAGIRLQREALGQGRPQTITSDRGYKVVTDAKGNIVGTNAPVAPVSNAVGGFADQRAAFNRGEGTISERAALGPNIRRAALAELSRSAPKSMTTTTQTPMGPPLQGSAQMGPPLQGSAQMGPPLQGSAQMGPPLQGSAQMGPPLQGSAQMGPPLQGSAQMGPPLAPNKPILSTSAPPKMFESAAINRSDLVGPPSNMVRPIQGPPNAAATTPYERMQKTTLGPAKPNGPILSTSAPPKMMESTLTKDDITKQRQSLAKR